MPRSIDELFEEAEQGPKGPYKPAKGEEAIFAAPQKGLLDYLAPLLPFYRQFTEQTPWQSPETAMEAIGWGMGGLMRGPGMVKAALPKGASSISKALEEISAGLFRKGGVPATIEKGPPPAMGGGRFQRMGAENVVEATGKAVPQQGQIAGAIERKQLPQYAGPTAPRGIPQPSAPQTWRERTFPGSIKRAQDVIEDLLGASIRAKGMEPKIPSVPGLKYHGIQKIPDYPDQYVFTDLKTGSTFYTKDPSPKNLIAERERVQAKFAEGLAE